MKIKPHQNRTSKEVKKALENTWSVAEIENENEFIIVNFYITGTSEITEGKYIDWRESK